MEEEYLDYSLAVGPTVFNYTTTGSQRLPANHVKFEHFTIDRFLSVAIRG